MRFLLAILILLCAATVNAQVVCENGQCPAPTAKANCPCVQTTGVCNCKTVTKTYSVNRVEGVCGRPLLGAPVRAVQRFRENKPVRSFLGRLFCR